MAHRFRIAFLILSVAIPFAGSAVAAPGSAEALLSSQAAVRALAVSAPAIDAPPAVAAASDQLISIQAVATDPNTGDLLTISATGYPAGLALSHAPGVSPATATLSGTLGDGDVGTFLIEWSVADGSGGTASTTTTLTVTANSAPTIAAPASVNGAEGLVMDFAVTVSDPDGDPITSLSAVGLPSGATFTVNAVKTVGQFVWTPAAGQAGTYSVTFSTQSGSPVRSASATTVLTIGPPDRPPVLSGPATVNGITGEPLTVVITASDPDGDPIRTFVAQGTQSTALPAGATFTANATNTSGTLSWTPSPAQAGTVSIDFIATSGPFNLRTVKIVKIVIAVDQPPVVTAPAAVSGSENASITFTVTAADPNSGQSIASLTAAPLPLGATFTSNATKTSGTFSWTPNFTQAGTHAVTFTAANGQSGSATTSITVTDQNRAPIANTGGPYSGVAGVAIAFDGSGSSDPDGDGLTYSWDFGDGLTGAGVAPSHAYGTGGAFEVSLTVTDDRSPALSGTASTTATISGSLAASVATSGGNKVIRLASGKPRWCAQVEPVDGSFDVAEIDLATIVLVYGDSQIPAEAGKTAASGDQDGDGVADITACFSKEALRTLFAGLPSGRTTVTVAIQASLSSGARISGEVEVDVFSSGGSLAATVSPNPLNPEAVLSFRTRTPGALRVQLYDVNGRLVRTLADVTSAAAGYHDVRIDGRGARGERLASGTYFFRIVGADGTTAGRITIMK